MLSSSDIFQNTNLTFNFYMNISGNPLGSDNLKEETLNHKVLLKLNQRTARKYITIIEGLGNFLKEDPKLFFQRLKKKFCTSGSIQEYKEYGIIFQLQGDHRKEIKALLIQERICSPSIINIQGF